MFAKLTRTYLTNYRHAQHVFPRELLITGSEITQIHTFKSCSKHTPDLHENGLNPDIKLNGYDLVYKIRECTNLGLYDYAQQLQCYVLRSGLTANAFISSALINFYVKFELVKDAHKLFDEIPEPGLVARNSLISGYVQWGKFRKGLSLFLELESSHLCSDSYSFTTALSASGQLNLLQLGKSIHSKIIKSGVECSTFVANCLIDMYGKCGHVKDATKVFDEMLLKDTFSWNSIIAACTRNQRIEQAFDFLNQMPDPDTISYNEIINGVAQFGNIDHAIKILSLTSNPNSSSWNSILTAYVNRNQPRNALQFFHKIHSNNTQMNEFTFSSILSGIAQLGALTWGVLVHSLVMKHGFNESVVIGSALIDMYSRCGNIDSSEFIFHSLPNKNLITWNAMISGYAHNDNPTKVIEIFKHLKRCKDIKPDGITFLNILTTFSRNNASLEVVNGYFESMINDYKIDPTMEHICCVIRVMGYEGEVWRAEGLIKGLGFGACGGVWRAVLAACGGCGDLALAEMAAKKVVELDGDDEFVYVMMSNIYARFGKWDDVRVTRKMMRDNRVVKEAGFSWIEIDDVVL